MIYRQYKVRVSALRVGSQGKVIKFFFQRLLTSFLHGE